jgi:type I restriction enzyme S subunit
MTLNTFFEKFALFADAPDAVAAMRRLILNLAVQGKLAPQDPNDESAEKLLQRIQVEKKRLAKAGEIKKQDQLPPVAEDAVPFPMPTGWKVAQLGDVAVCLDYMRKPINGTERSQRIAGKDQSKLFPYYGATQQQGWIDEFIFDAELVLLGEDGVPFFDDLRSKAYLISGKTWVNNHAHVFRGILVSNLFLMHCLNVFDYTGRVAGTTRSKLNQAKAIDIPIPLPPLAEQKRIVAKVDELMALCDRLEAQQKERGQQHTALSRASLARFADAPTPANLQLLFHKSYTISPADLRKSILTLAVQGKLVAQDSKDEPAKDMLARLARELTPKQRRSQAAPLSPFPAESLQYELPDSWAWARFCDVAIIASNLVKPNEFLDFTHLAPDNIEKGNGVLLPCRTVREDKVISSNHRFFPGQIVYSKIRPNLAKVVVVDFDGLCSADMYPIDALIDAFYLQRYMLSESFLVQAVKTDTRVAMPKINQMELNAIAVPVPPLAEQRRIVAKVEQLMALVDGLETQLAASRATAKNLLDALVAELTNGSQKAS